MERGLANESSSPADCFRHCEQKSGFYFSNALHTTSFTQRATPSRNKWDQLNWQQEQDFSGKITTSEAKPSLPSHFPFVSLIGHSKQAQLKGEGQCS